MQTRVSNDERSIFLACAQAEEEYVHGVGGEVMDELLPALPVFVPAAGHGPLPGEHWSMPGRLKGSARIEYGSRPDGHAQADISLDRVYRFSRKPVHGIRRVLEEALASVVARFRGSVR